MPSDNTIAREAIYKFLQETNTIYDLCKEYLILIEEILPRHKAPIHAANELKSLVFHLYKCADTGEYEENILEAKEHLCRAFYDLHSLLISIYIEQIRQKLVSYKDKTILKVFPDYGSTIRPVIKELQENLQALRSNRNTDVAMINKSIPIFESQISTLARFDDIVESMRPEMNDYDQKLKRKSIGRIVLSLLLAIALLSIGYYLGGRA